MPLPFRLPHVSTRILSTSDQHAELVSRPCHSFSKPPSSFSVHSQSLSARSSSLQIFATPE